MRQALRIGVMAAAAATSMLSMPGAGAAALTGDEADAGASASAADTAPHEEQGYGETPRSETTAHSPGLLSGNTVQAPVDIGVNLCGNTADVVGALNPATGNACAGSGDASAAPTPVEEHLPPAPPATPATPVTPEAPSTPAPPPTERSVPNVPQASVPRPGPGHDVLSPVAAVRAPQARERLADTGADPNLLAAAAASAGLLVGGGILYRRSSPARR
ncbi:chaplin [Streptomyces sp. NPDC088785]|uniref:chaplin n=1 Tax=Streptomyces sp. NPDC088785 TaxID=3365897 RepID=UPI003823CE64